VGSKAEALLAHLALQHGRRVPRERLVQWIWPESAPAAAFHSLNSLTYTLHKLLGQVLQAAKPVLHEDGYYRLNVEAGIGADVVIFDQLTQNGDAYMRASDRAAALTAYQQAAELYRGDLSIASGVHTVMERERLRARYLTLLAQLADHHIRAGDYSACLDHLWRLLSRDACREDAHRLVMRCFVRRGERAAALHQYKVCEDTLRAELGVVPEAATVVLAEQIRCRPETV
jgi:DNA-binding SARP family transcriptional activator